MQSEFYCPFHFDIAILRLAEGFFMEQSNDIYCCTYYKAIVYYSYNLFSKRTYGEIPTGSHKQIFICISS